MSATPFSLTASKWYWRLDLNRRRAGGLGRARPPPGLERDAAGKPEDQERDERVEDPNHCAALASPGEHDLDDHQQRRDEVHDHTPLPEPRAKRQQEQDHASEEDQVAEAVVKVEPVRELVLAQRARVGLVRC